MGQLTEQQRDALEENLKLELGNRIQRLRAQHDLAARALRSKIGMRLYRVPKRLWNKTVREITEDKSTTEGSFTLSDLSKVLIKPSMEDQLQISKVRNAKPNSKSDGTTTNGAMKVGLAKNETAKQKQSVKNTSKNTQQQSSSTNANTSTTTTTKTTAAKKKTNNTTATTATAASRRKKNANTTNEEAKPALKKTAANSSSKVAKANTKTARSVSNSSNNSTGSTTRQQPRRNLRSRAAAS